jgi:5-formyltetrahydrofolate cyclo-ligase
MEIMTKEQYRHKMFALRSGLKQEQVDSRSQKVVERFLSFSELQKYSNYLAYLPINKEVDTTSLLSRLLGLGKNVYLPRCHEDLVGQMDFFRIFNFSDLRPGYCGIYEPCLDLSMLYINHDRALCILPGLAFDRKGFRLGYGRGFFDRYFKSLQGPMPFLTGFAYDFQVVDFLPADEWDIPVDLVVSDEEIIFTSQKD